MEGMDVLIDPKRERLIANPDSPEVAKMMLMAIAPSTQGRVS
jgi:hypothetical protein